MRRAFLLVAFALLALSVPGCGDDSGPADTTTTTEAETTSTTVAASTTVGTDTTVGGEVPVSVYFGRDEQVGPVRRFAGSPDTVARDALAALLAGPTEEEVGWGFTTEVPTGTELLGVEIADAVATVDLSEEFETGGGSLSMQLRVAQVVFTLTQFPGVDRVAFRIDGEPRTAIGGEGVVVDPPVGRDAFTAVTPVILVESPLPGESVGGTLTVTGSSATFEGTVQLTVTDGEGEIVYEGFFTSTGANGVWGPFEETITLGPARPGTGAVILWEEDVSGTSPSGQQNVVEIPVEIPGS